MIMGIEKRKVAKALCETESLEIALVLLTKETMAINKQKAEDVLEKIQDEIVEIKISHKKKSFGY